MDPSQFPDNFEIHTHRAMPVVAAFFRRLGLVEAIDRAVPSEMDVSVGTHTLAMVLDCLTGRSPLHHVETTFEGVDTELLFGVPVDAEQFNDDALGRALDRLQGAGTESLFTRLSVEACRKMDVPIQCGNFDATSLRVFGDRYDRRSGDSNAIQVTHGFSKDHRPDLYQFMMCHLCVGGNIPIMGGARDGNADEKKLNNEELSKLSELLKKHGIDRSDFTYVADCAMVNEENIHELDGMNFVTRLPATFNAHDELIDQALQKGMHTWTKLGPLSQSKGSDSRSSASYTITELPLTLYERELRAVIIHSDRHDKRKIKALERRIEKERIELSKLINTEAKVEYACGEDARGAFERLRKKVDASSYHRLEGIVGVEPRYARGRPRKDGSRNVEKLAPVFLPELKLKEDAVKQARLRAGCFVLISRMPKQKSSADVLRCYKGQHGIERNFSFLKDDAITNSIFLKRPERIEALTFILLLALLIWNLIQRKIRQWAEVHNQDLPGNDKRPTRTPTTFVMLLHFTEVKVLQIGQKRQLHKPPRPEIAAYLQALDLGPWIYTNPSMKYK